MCYNGALSATGAGLGRRFVSEFPSQVAAKEDLGADIDIVSLSRVDRASTAIDA
jgi:hypothetical protein